MPPGRMPQRPGARPDRDDHDVHDAIPHRPSSTHYSSHGAIPPHVADRIDERAQRSSASERGYGGEDARFGRMKHEHDHREAVAAGAAEDRRFARIKADHDDHEDRACKAHLPAHDGPGSNSMGPTAPASAPYPWFVLTGTRPPGSEPFDPFGLHTSPAKQVLNQPRGSKLPTLVKQMEGRSDSEQLAIVQQVLRDDPKASEWLDDFSSLHYRNGQTSVPPALIAELQDTLMFTPEGMKQYLHGGAEKAVDKYEDKTKDLRWLINNHGASMTPAGLDAAITNYKAGKGDKWNQEVDDAQRGVVAQGERILSVLNDPRMQQLSPEQREAMMHTLVDPGNPAGTTALTMAFTKTGGVKPAVLDGAMAFFAETGLRDSAPQLANVVADARVREVSHSIQTLDASDPCSVREVRAEIHKLRDASYASLRGIDAAHIDELEKTVDALESTVKVGMTPAQMQASLQTFSHNADALDQGAGHNVSEALRLLAMQSGASGMGGMGGAGGASAMGGGGGASAMDISSELAGWVGLSADSSSLLAKAGIMSGSRVIGALTGDVLGGVLMGFSAIELVRAIQDGGIPEQVLAGMGVGAGALAMLPGLAGPMAGVGVALWIAGMGVEQWRKVQESNKYMNHESSEFLGHSGLAPDIAGALVDQSGEGFSPVPYLFKYAQTRGLSREETVAWLNSLTNRQVAWIRDRAHHSLDKINGDLNKLDGASDPDNLETAALSDPQFAEYLDAGSWREFEAMFHMVGVPIPTPG